jgi:endoglucanase
MRKPIARGVSMLAAALAGVSLAFALTTIAGSRPALASTTPSVPLSIAIDGNHFISGTGQTIRLLGVDRPGTEYACEEGWGDSDGDDTADAAAADAAAIASWDANAVRVPLNEDCWLGINGEPSYGTVSSYQHVVQQFVADLNADGIYAILDLHWSAPGTVVADGQRPMPDDHSAAFWGSVASAFKADPAVLFDVFNEPYSPATDFPDAASYPVSWSCWQDGGCTLPVTVDGTDPGSDPQTYTAVGMQALVDAIRTTGASQPILLGGLAYANDLSGWLAHEPTDRDNQLAASFHNYEGEACATLSCWNDEIAPVAAQVPLVTGEFDESADCPVGNDDGFDQAYMDWADEAGVSYLAWGWYVPDSCGYQLIDGSDLPVAPNGTALYDHLTALAAAQTTTTQTTTTPTTTSTSGPSVTATPPAPTPPATAPPAAPTKPTKPTHRRPRKRCLVPRLHGDHLTAARRRLTASHCRLGRVTGPRGRRAVVASQHPKPGTHGRTELRVALALAEPPTDAR